jgi:hypothetical protein
VVALVFGIAVAVAALGLLGAYIGRVALATPVRYVIAFRPILMGVYRLEADSRSAAEPKAFRRGMGGAFGTEPLFSLVIGTCRTAVLVLSFAAYEQSFIYGGLLLFLYGIGDGFPLMLVGTAAGRCAEADRLQPFRELNRPHSRGLARPARLLFALASLNGVSSPRRSPGRETPNPLVSLRRVSPGCACVPLRILTISFSWNPVRLLDSRARKRLASKRMGTTKPVLLAVLAVAFAAYGSDCLAMTTPEQAMRCCRSMPCSSHGHHAKDCCQTMGAHHFPFVQGSTRSGIFLSHVAIAIAPESVQAPRLDSRAFKGGVWCHAPPSCMVSSLPIRI